MENEICSFQIHKATLSDIDAVTKLAMLLYEDNDYSALRIEMEETLKQGTQIIFLAVNKDQPIGFAHCSLRYDYVEGTKSGNVGYLEGIYVCEPYRKQGIAKELVNQCENWAREKGCREFASDCELKNENSYRFHLKIGFTEANRIICFTKKL